MTRTHVLVLLVVLALLLGGVAAVRKLGKTESERRDRLHPRVQAALDALRAEMSVYGIEILIVNTRRTEDEQAAKVAAGLSATTQSWHLLGRAVDVQTGRKDAAGKVTWDPNGKNVADYRKLHEVARRHGFRGVPQGSPFDSRGAKAYISTKSGQVWDVGHLEFTEGMTFAQAKARDAGTAIA